MGSYTTLVCKIKLRKDTPDEIINFLKKVIINHSDDIPTDNYFYHEFFKCERWNDLFTSLNWSDDIQGGKFYVEKENWVIYLQTEFKNYDNEIDKFIDWIKPYVLGRKKKQYISWKEDEGSWFPRINLYVERNLKLTK